MSQARVGGRAGCAASEHPFLFRGSLEAGLLSSWRERLAPGRRGVDAVGAPEQKSAVGSRGYYDPIETPEAGKVQFPFHRTTGLAQKYRFLDKGK